jgi:antitoxin (DNA-binding transcriptional repressor) of toxin-antitoxin stability system
MTQHGIYLIKFIVTSESAMITANIAEVKAHLSEYLAALENGETVTICRRNVPVAEIRPIAQPRREPRPIGLGPGGAGYELPDSFWEPLPEEMMVYFRGDAPDPLLVLDNPVPGKP